MEKAGLLLSSNRDLDEKSSIHTKINELFPVVNDLSRMGNVFDLPVTSFRSPLKFFDGSYRHFEICALGSLEMNSALRGMANSGYSCATILTHPTEFFRRFRNSTVPLKKNCRRLEKLLRNIKEDPDMIPLTVSQSTYRTEILSHSPREIKLNFPYSLLRLFDQGFERIWHWGLAQRMEFKQRHLV